MLEEATPDKVLAGIMAGFMALLVGPEISGAMWPAVFDIAGPIPGLAWEGVVGGNMIALAEAAILTMPVVVIVVGLPMGTIGIFLLVYRALVEE